MLERLATVPLNAETTSPYTHKVVKFSYLTLVNQHPLGYSDTAQSNKEISISMLGPLRID